MQSKTFIHQLHGILQQSELEPWIRWEPEDERPGVFVLRPHDPGFSSKVLKRYFKHGNVSSFVRQLHMYGFHKLSSGSGARGSAGSTHSSGSGSGGKPDKAATIWQFAHPSGAFCRDSPMSELNRIQRKSGGVGKNGKRRNVLSAVSVNYVDTTPHGTPLGTPHPASSLSTLEDPQSVSQSSQLPVSQESAPTPHAPQAPAPALAPALAPAQAPVSAPPPPPPSAPQQPLLPQSMSPLPSLRNLPTPTQQQLDPGASPVSPGQLSHKGSIHSSHSIAQPLSSSLPLSTPVPPAAVASHASLAPPGLQHLQSNINLLQRSMVTLLDVLQQFSTQSAPDSETITNTLQGLRNEIITADTKWTHLRHPMLSAHSSFSSVGSSISHPAAAFSSRFPSLSTQKSSVFSNSRISNASLQRCSSFGQGSTDSLGLGQQNKKK